MTDRLLMHKPFEEAKYIKKQYKYRESHLNIKDKQTLKLKITFNAALPIMLLKWKRFQKYLLRSIHLNACASTDTHSDMLSSKYC